MSRRYVAAFIGPRDAYELPLALAEKDILERLVTDFYLPDWARPLIGGVPPRLAERLGKRYRAQLSSKLVENNWGSLFRQLRDPHRRRDPITMAFLMDKALSTRAGAIARETDSNLFLHNGAGYWAFDACLDRQRLLFQFHPHSAFLYPLLAQDVERFPEVRHSFATEYDSAPLEGFAPEHLIEWRLATAVLCASSFTKRSLVAQGCASDLIKVAPYGGEPLLTHLARPAKARRRCQFLFVGQGVQRKGLHHLLRAWRSADLKCCDLRLVCTRLDPGLLPLTDQPNVTLSAKVSLGELHAVYARSDIFVMPSIAEGFGLVYLEAMSAGLHCIGSRNTGLPDLHPPADIASLVDAGDLDGLAESLIGAYRQWSTRAIDPETIRRFSQKRAWRDFRSDVQSFAHRAA